MPIVVVTSDGVLAPPTQPVVVMDNANSDQTSINQTGSNDLTQIVTQPAALPPKPIPLVATRDNPDPDGFTGWGWFCAKHPRNPNYNIMSATKDKKYFMCAGDGQSCLWYSDLASCQEAQQKISAGDYSTIMNPLTCGPMHAGLYGDPGTTNPGHWCYSQRTDLDITLE
jgi:hypothetical protein